MTRYKKRFFPAKPSSPNPWRVINPIAEHIFVNLKERQGINLILDEPRSLNPLFSRKATWSISLESDFFILSEVDIVGKKTNDIERKIYSFHQKYNLEDCSFFGKKPSFSLGNIVATIKDEDNKDAPFIQSFVIVNQSSDILDDTVVSLDPKDCFCFLDGNQSLQVFLPLENDFSSWKYEVDEFATNYKVNIDSFSSCQSGKIFSSNPCSHETRSKFLQHDLSDKKLQKICFSIKEIDEEQRQSKQIARLSFKDNNRNIRSLNVIVKKNRNSRKSNFVSLPKPKATSPKELAICRRDCTMTEKTPCLVNPCDGEIVEFSPYLNEVSLKIAKPVVFNDSLREEWFIVQNIKDNFAHIGDYGEDTIFGCPFQKAKVFINSEKLSSAKESCYLGNITIKTKDLPERKVHLFYSPDDFDRKSSEINKECETNSFQRYYSGSNNTFGQVSKFISKKTFSPINIKNVTFQLQKGSIYEGIQVENFEIPKIENHTVKQQSIKDYKPSILADRSGTVTFLDPRHKESIVFSDSVNVIMPGICKQPEGDVSTWGFKVVDDRFMEIKNTFMKNSKDLCIEVKSLFYNLYKEKNSKDKELIGIIDFFNGKETRTVNFYSIGSNSISFSAIKKNFKEFNECKIDNSETSKTKVIRSFEHNSAVLVSPTESLWIKIPELPNGKKFTQIKIIQTAIDKSIINLPIFNKIRDRLNSSEPWYPSQATLNISGVVVIRPVSYINADFIKLALAYANNGKPVHVAELIFSDEINKEDAIISPYGKIETIDKIEKTINIFVKSEEPKAISETKENGEVDYVPVLNNPHDEECVSVKRNGKLKVIFDEIRDNNSISSWYCKAAGDFIKYNKMEKEDGKFNFTFDITGNQSIIKSYLIFVSNTINSSKEVKINVNLDS